MLALAYQHEQTHTRCLPYPKIPVWAGVLAEMQTWKRHYRGGSCPSGEICCQCTHGPSTDAVHKCHWQASQEGEGERVIQASSGSLKQSLEHCSFRKSLSALLTSTCSLFTQGHGQGVLV
eukprot:1161720-Pelagomonas_calceolata.AAC.7